MPWGTVKVVGPDSRDVYVNGNYAEAVGVTGGTFPVEYGDNRFETLDPEFRVDFSVRVTVDDTNRNAEATLLPVVPPRRTALTPEATQAGGGR